MSLFKQATVAAVITSLLLSGCAATNTEKGAAIGAVAGAILGKSTGNHKKKRYAWGAAIGAITGAAIGAYMDEQEQAFRDDLSGSGIEIVREGDNLRLVMPSNITFATGKSEITSGFYPVLNDIAKVLKKYDKTLLSIEGHTDSVGSYEYNQTLSEARANSVKTYLVSHDILNNRIKTSGLGEFKPLVDNTTASNRALNRRVEIQIIPKRA